MDVERSGQCNHCGVCCTWEYAKVLEMFKDRRDEEREWCPHYDKTVETNHCRIQGNKPEGCRLFPRTARDVPATCGF